MLQISQERKFEIIVDNANRCNLCTRMQGRTRVLSTKNGNIHSKVVFIGEAPGRLGADKTGIPFFGDKTGRNFEQLLLSAGLTREEVFITNAILCNPRNENGNNSVPNKQELKNCSLHLSMILDLVQPTFIVTLGINALNALNILEPHEIRLKEKVASLVKWRAFSILPLYHPGPRAAIHRSFSEQANDFLYLGSLLGSTTKTNKLF